MSVGHNAPLKGLQSLHPSARLLLRTALWHGSETANTEFHSDLEEGHSFTLLIYGNNTVSGGELIQVESHRL